MKEYIAEWEHKGFMDSKHISGDVIKGDSKKDVEEKIKSTLGEDLIAIHFVEEYKED